MLEGVKAAFSDDPSNDSPFPSCCNSQQFISPPLSALCCRIMSLMFANLPEVDRKKVLSAFVDASSSPSTEKVSCVLYTTFVGRYFTLLGTLMDLHHFKKYREDMLARHNTAYSVLQASNPKPVAIYTSETFRHPDRSSQDPTSSLYESNYMPKRKEFLFDLNCNEDSKIPLNDYGDIDDAFDSTRDLYTKGGQPLKRLFEVFFTFGKESAKFDNGYCLYSVWKADDCYLAGEVHGDRPVLSGLSPDPLSSSHLFHMKRLLAWFADDTKGLTEHPDVTTLSPFEHKKYADLSKWLLKSLEEVRLSEERRTEGLKQRL